MLQYISYFGSSSEILNPFTLEYHIAETNKIYLNAKFSSIHHIVCSLMEIILSIAVSILSIILYSKDNNRLNNLRLLLSLFTLVFLIINVIFFFNEKKCQLHRRTLLIYSDCIHICSYKFLFYFLISIVKYEYPSSYEDVSNFLWVVESFFAITYLIFIDNTFILHFVCHIITFLFIFIIETFLCDKIQFSLIMLCSFLEAILIVSICYVFQKQCKLEFFHNYAKLQQVECLSEMINCGAVISATFKKNTLHNYSRCLLKVLENSAYKTEIDNIILKNPELDLEKETNSAYLNQVSIIIKKILFHKIKLKNENIFFLIKEQIMNLQKEEGNIQDRINSIFTTIRENKEMFKTLNYLGTIEFDNMNQQYSVFIHVNQATDNINYIALGLDFPIEVSQNIEMLEKISILNSKITHEIKNPLAAIQTLVSEIKTFTENTGTNDVINKLTTIFDYTEYMKFITKDFEFFAMKLSNLSEQRNIAKIDIKRVNFYNIVDFSLNLIKHIWKNKNSKVLINKSIDQNISEYINTDEIRLKQIIINLLSNSLKFTKMGSVTLTCRNEDQNFISIMVTDTGVGMKEEQVKALNSDDCLFVKSNENNQMGSGLGLSIVKDMVKILGTDFKIESKYSEGTKISFLLNKNISMNVPLGENENNQNSKKELKGSKTQPTKKRNELTLSNANQNTTGSNLHFVDNKMDTKLIVNEEQTKREDYVLLKPQENTNDTNYENSSTEFKFTANTTTKALHSFNQKPKNRMSIIAKTHLNNKTSKPNTEREFPDSSRYLNKKKIYALVVEDDQILRNSNVNVITKYFSEKGIDVSIDENTDGIECIYKIFKGFSKEKKYSFIVTDEEMTVMNGTIMTNIIRALIEGKRFYPLKIYLSSGNNFVNNSTKNIYEGVFPKPLTRDCVAQIFKENYGNCQ